MIRTMFQWHALIHCSQWSLALPASFFYCPGNFCSYLWPNSFHTCFMLIHLGGLSIISQLQSLLDLTHDLQAMRFPCSVSILFVSLFCSQFYNVICMFYCVFTSTSQVSFHHHFLPFILFHLLLPPYPWAITILLSASRNLSFFFLCLAISPFSPNP